MAHFQRCDGREEDERFGLAGIHQGLGWLGSESGAIRSSQRSGIDRLLGYLLAMSRALILVPAPMGSIHKLTEKAGSGLRTWSHGIS